MKALEKEVRKYLEDRAWDKLRPGDLAKSVAIEAGELLEIFQWENPELETVKGNPEKLSALKKELADVLIYCFEMAVLLDLDVASIMREKLEKARKKYPAELFKDLDPSKQGAYDIYWKIKKEYRQSGEE
jgi:NTP pyrophosphatase (non-canonical NTP hydrolase)